MCRCKIYFSVFNNRPSLEHEFILDCCHWFGLFSRRELVDSDGYVSIREEQKSPMDCFWKAVKDLARLDGYLDDCRRKYDASFNLDIAVFSPSAHKFQGFIDDTSCLEILSKHPFRIAVKTGEDFEHYEQDFHSPDYDPSELVY